MTTARDQATLGRAIQERFPRYYRYFATSSFISRPCDPQPQSPARQCRGRRRHQDRLHPRLRLQSRDLDAPRQPPYGRRRARRPQRRFARCHHAQSAGGKSRKRRQQPHRCRDKRARRSEANSDIAKAEAAARSTQTFRSKRRFRLPRSLGARRCADDALDRTGRKALGARRRHRGCAAAASPSRGSAPPQAKADPAPLTSGVIQTQQLAAIPGSSEPMGRSG